jgi:hypothetical protein
VAALTINSPPSFGSVTVTASNLTVSGSGGTTNGNYYLLTSTNLALPRTNWPRIATNAFDATGNFRFTNAINPAQPAQFFLIRTP